MDLPPLSPLSSMYDPRSPCASSKAGSTPSDDDVPMTRRRSSAITPPSTPSPPSTDSQLPMQRVSSVMSLDIPLGKAENLPHAPPPRPATPNPSRLPRSRVFIKHPSARATVDPVAVGAASDGETRLIVRHLARPASPGGPSSVVRQPKLSRAAHSTGARRPAVLCDDAFYFSDDDGGGGGGIGSASVGANANGVSAQGPRRSSLEIPTAPISAPVTSGVSCAQPMSLLSVSPPPSTHTLSETPVVVATMDSGLSTRVRRAVSALRSISFQTAAPEDVDTAWGQVPSSASSRALSAAVAESGGGGVLEGRKKGQGVGRNSDVRSPSPCASAGSSSARRRARPTLAASRWRRPRGRISSKHGVLSYDCYSEADARSRRVSEDVPNGTAPPTAMMTGTGLEGDVATGLVATAAMAAAQDRAYVRRDAMRDSAAMNRRSAPVRNGSYKSLWTGRREMGGDGNGARAAAALWMGNAGQSVLAVDVGERTKGVDYRSASVDKYVEFIHASAQRETTKVKPKKLTGRVMQAMFGRKWK